MLERLFQLKAHNTNVRTEILAGVTTFLAMAYILFVNPSILGETGMDKGAVFVAAFFAFTFQADKHPYTQGGCQVGNVQGFKHGPH